MRRRLLYAALVSTFFLGLAEGAARLVLPPPPPVAGIPLQEDPDILWTLSSADHAPPNALGLRGRDVADRNSVRGRILTLGDSSVYGDTVTDDQVFSAVAARRLPGVDAVNGGIPGYSSVQASVLFGRVQPKVRADVVVIGTLWSDAAPGEETDREHIARVRADLGRWGPVNRAFRSLQARFALSRLVRQVMHGNLSFPSAAPVNKVGWVHADESLPLGTFSRVPVGEYTDNLRALVADVRPDALPVLLLLPHPLDDLHRALPERLQVYRTAMRGVAEELDVPLVDGQAWFTTHPSPTSRFADDIHPNAQGHAEIAEALLSVVTGDPVLSRRLGQGAR